MTKAFEIIKLSGRARHLAVTDLEAMLAVEHGSLSTELGIPIECDREELAVFLRDVCALDEEEAERTIEAKAKRMFKVNGYAVRPVRGTGTPLRR
jgi:hypothetical protein